MNLNNDLRNKHYYSYAETMNHLDHIRGLLSNLELEEMIMIQGQLEDLMSSLRRRVNSKKELMKWARNGSGS